MRTLTSLRKELALAERAKDTMRRISQGFTWDNPGTERHMNEAYDAVIAYVILVRRDVQVAEHAANEEAKREALLSRQEGVTK